MSAIFTELVFTNLITCVVLVCCDILLLCPFKKSSKAFLKKNVSVLLIILKVKVFIFMADKPFVTSLTFHMLMLANSS